MDLKRRIPALTLGSMVLAATALSGVSAVAAQDEMAGPVYRFTITNNTPGQPLTPPVIAIHDANTAVVTGGAPASEGIQQQAENGNNGPLVEALEADPYVFGIGQGESPIVAEGVPGSADFPASVTIDVSGAEGAGYFTLTAMMICTNDGFAVLDNEMLPTEMGEIISLQARAYDAGTETNTEDHADLVPPCQGLTGVASDDDGAGASNPDLAEGGVIAPHAGIAGGTDLDAEIHAIATYPADVTVELIG